MITARPVGREKRRGRQIAADGVGAILRRVSVGAAMTRARPSPTCPTRGIAVAGPHRLCTPPTPRHRGDAEKRVASRRWWRLSGTSIGHGLLPTSYLSFVLASYLRVGLLPTSYQPLTNLLPEPLTWGLPSYQALTWHAEPEGALTGGVGPALTDLLPRGWPLTDLLPEPLTWLLLENPASYQPLTWTSYLRA